MDGSAPTPLARYAIWNECCGLNALGNGYRPFGNKVFSFGMRVSGTATVANHVTYSYTGTPFHLFLRPFGIVHRAIRPWTSYTTSELVTATLKLNQPRRLRI